MCMRVPRAHANTLTRGTGTAGAEAEPWAPSCRLLRVCRVWRAAARVWVLGRRGKRLPCGMRAGRGEGKKGRVGS